MRSRIGIATCRSVPAFTLTTPTVHAHGSGLDSHTSTPIQLLAFLLRVVQIVPELRHGRHCHAKL